MNFAFSNLCDSEVSTELVEQNVAGFLDELERGITSHPAFVLAGNPFRVASQPLMKIHRSTSNCETSD
jgi:hypothetical protein